MTFRVTEAEILKALSVDGADYPSTMPKTTQMAASTVARHRKWSASSRQEWAAYMRAVYRALAKAFSAGKVGRVPTGASGRGVMPYWRLCAEWRGGASDEV